jgi:hypothetical protein
MCYRAPAIRLVACLVLSIASALLIAPRPARACTPPPGGLPGYTAAERARDSDIVIVGTVTAVSDEPSSIPGDTATIDVERYLKGLGPDPITVSGYGPGSLCLSQVGPGNRLIFYIVRDGPDSYRAYYKSQFDAVAAPDAGTIAEIEAAVAATANRLYLVTLSSPAGPAGSLPAALPSRGLLAGLPLPAAVGLLTLLGIVVVARRRH